MNKGLFKIPGPIGVQNVPLELEKEFAVYEPISQKEYRYLLIFVTTLNEMKEGIKLSEARLMDQGIAYLAYPKLKNPKNLPGIHRDDIFPFLGVNPDNGYVPGTLLRFNQMTALNDTYTVLGLKKDSTRKERSKTSQKVADYESRIPDLVSQLDPDVKNLFQTLTPGYQKGWARFVYSTANQALQKERINEMKHILKLGYKSKELYRQAKEK